MLKASTAATTINSSKDELICNASICRSTANMHSQWRFSWFLPIDREEDASLSQIRERNQIQ